MPQTGNISVSFSAFVPPSSADTVYYSYTYGLTNGETFDLGYCYAPLQLPHGAKITNATFYLYDQWDNGTFLFDVIRSNATGSYEQIGWVWKNPGSGMTENTRASLNVYTPDIAIVDNNNYQYYILMLFPHSDHGVNAYRFYYALIEYSYP